MRCSHCKQDRNSYTRDGDKITCHDCWQFLRTPVLWLDNAMLELKPSAFMVFMVIVRRTIGYNRASAQIALSLFMKITGLTQPTVLKATRECIAKGFVIKEDDEYRVACWYGEGKRVERKAKAKASIGEIEVYQ